jgi:tRNA 2-thiouridine synthesizing protein A
MTETLQIDARRLLCPMPVIRLQNSIADIEPGQRVEITCTDPGVLHDIPTWCRINGHTVISTITNEQNYEYCLIVEKSISGD